MRSWLPSTCGPRRDPWQSRSLADEGGHAARHRLVAARPQLVQKHEGMARELEWQQQRLGDALERSLDQVIDDDVLQLLFTACHPVLAVEGRIALTLRLVGAHLWH
jgi:predicted RNA polymerase sigma factor